MLPQSIEGKFNVKVGDSFDFSIDRFRSLNLSTTTASLGSITFREGGTLNLEFTIVDPPLLKTRLIIDGNSYETIFFISIVVKNRTWDKLTIEQQKLGYNVFEDEDFWGFQVFNSSFIINAKYWKHDGVLVYFYAYKHPALLSLMDIGELKFTRISEMSKNIKWPYAFLAVIPIVGTVVVIVVIQKKKGISTK